MVPKTQLFQIIYFWFLNLRFRDIMYINCKCMWFLGATICQIFGHCQTQFANYISGLWQNKRAQTNRETLLLQNIRISIPHSLRSLNIIPVTEKILSI
jgi:hypothetical protein